MIFWKDIYPGPITQLTCKRQPKFSLKEFQSPEYFSHPFNIIPYFHNHFRKHLCFKPQSSRNISPYLLSRTHTWSMTIYWTNIAHQFFWQQWFFSRTRYWKIWNWKLAPRSQISPVLCYFERKIENDYTFHLTLDLKSNISPIEFFMRECTFHTLFKFASTLHYF